MFTRKPLLQPEKFAVDGAKRLLQHNLPQAEISRRFDVWRRSAWRGKRSNGADRRRYGGFELAAPPVYGVACLVYRQTN
jgi:hypothetical protein